MAKIKIKTKVKTQAPSAPSAPSAPTLTSKIGEVAGSIPKNLGLGAGKLMSGGAGGEFGSGFEKGLFGTQSNIGQNIGRAGMGGGILGTLGYYIGPKVMNAFKGSPEASTSGGKPVTPEMKKWRDKARKDVMGGLVGDYRTTDLDASHNSSDEGWRAGLKSLSKDELNAHARKAVESGDATGLYNAIVRKAREQGKSVNQSKPVYIPAVFNKSGKQMAYALDASEGKVKMIPIEMGKGVTFEE